MITKFQTKFTKISFRKEIVPFYQIHRKLLEFFCGQTFTIQFVLYLKTFILISFLFISNRTISNIACFAYRWETSEYNFPTREKTAMFTR